VIVSAGIRPRDELAREAGLDVAPRGGIAVDDALATSDPRITAIGECAVHRGVHYGLVAPGYEMADVLARRLAGEDVRFAGADLSAKLKLLGVDVASFGDYFADLERPDQARALVFEDRTEGVYQKLLFDAKCERLLGGILVGDAGGYVPLLSHAKSGAPVPSHARELLFGASGAPAAGSAASLPDAAQICSCNNVSKGDLVSAIADHALTTIAEVKKCTRAATGCGGCQPSVVSILEAELARSGHELVRHMCEHFPYTRQDLFRIVKLAGSRSFDALLDSHGAATAARCAARRWRRSWPRPGTTSSSSTRRSRTPTTASSPTSSAAAATR
jgi:nitrite reductase (NADH) large subunit